MTTSKEQHHLYKYYVEPQAVSDMTRRTLVLVLAGGEGSRLKNLTKWRAKPAVPFGGKYRIIDFALSNCINSGLRRIGVLTQYKSHSLIRHLQRAWGFMRPEIGEFVEIIPAQQRLRPEWYQGTADAIYQNLDIIYRHEPDYVLVLGGDHIYTMNYAAMLAAHVQTDAELTIGCIEVPLADAREFGVMSVDEDFRITKFTEKPANPEPVPGKPDVALASMGIYIFSMEYLTKALIRDAEDDTSQHDFGKNIIPAAIEQARSIAYPYLNNYGEPAYWRDVGSLDSYWKANIELCDIEPELNLYERDWPIWTYQTQSPPAKFAFDDEGRRGQAIDSLVAGGCIISGAKVKRSVIFFNTQIETGTYVKESVILPKVRIGRNCKLIRCIVDKGTVIPDNFEIGVNIDEDRKRFLVTEQGIVLVTPGMMNQRLHYERD
ncbi:MAG: glucose-1-phosphate adenylyltransferase [Gammaproteobacteria bacterium]|nr:glucose-1-phosphate adenylyltransferase [Gammaproteobacteria bacterium]